MSEEDRRNYLHDKVERYYKTKPWFKTYLPAPGNVYVKPLRFKLGGRPVLSARLNVETARSERKRPEI
jgi:hypothetical protein|eukprot:COSAG06_NODE_7497_length_2483_cov_2.635067_1_plen_68_part_00